MFSILSKDKSFGIKFHFTITKFLLPLLPTKPIINFFKSKLFFSAPIKTKSNFLPSIFNQTGEMRYSKLHR